MNIDFGFITTIITSLLSGGGITYLLFFREKKKEKELDVIKRQMDIINDYAKDIAGVRAQLDKANSQVAILTTLKCQNLACINRKPPLQDITHNINDEGGIQQCETFQK